MFRSNGHLCVNRVWCEGAPDGSLTDAEWTPLTQSQETVCALFSSEP